MLSRLFAFPYQFGYSSISFPIKPCLSLLLCFIANKASLFDRLEPFLSWHRYAVEVFYKEYRITHNVGSSVQGKEMMIPNLLIDTGSSGTPPRKPKSSCHLRYHLFEDRISL